jgi:DNA modification methylase
MTTTIIQGDVRAMLATMPAESVHCCVTSPPYWGLRDYGVDGQLGLEPTPEEFIANMVDVFRGVRRVLRDDGTLWLNIGDSYAAGCMTGKRGSNSTTGYNAAQHEQTAMPPRKPPPGLKPKDLCMIPARLALALQADGWYLRSEIIWAKGVSFCDAYSGSVMPESCRDRPTSAHEKLYLLTKAPRYYYDAEAVMERRPQDSVDRCEKYGDNPSNAKFNPNRNDGGRGGSTGFCGNPAGRNLRNVWTINPQPYAAAHFATYPEALVRPCIQAGTSERGVCPECGAPWERVVERGESSWEARKDAGHDPAGYHVGDKSSQISGQTCVSGKAPSGVATGGLGWVAPSKTVGWQPSCECAPFDFVETDAAPVTLGSVLAKMAPVPATVLDPFAGSGTTLAVAAKLGRSAIGIELNPEYIELAEKRIALAKNCAETPSLL